MPKGGSEHEHQTAYFQWVRLRALTDERFACIYAVPNEQKAGYAVAAKMVEEGLMSGVPDVNVDVPIMRHRNWYIEEDAQLPELTACIATPTVGHGDWFEFVPGLRIETKAPYRRNQKNGGVEEAQLEWHRRLRAQGFRVEVAWGVDEMIDITCNYLGVKRDA